MTLSVADDSPLVTQRKRAHRSRGFWAVFFSRMLRNRISMAGAVLILAVLLVAVLAPLLAPYDPDAVQIRERLQPPSAAHIFGTDELGRDIASRVIYGAQISFYVGLISVGIGLGVGVLIGLIGGYLGGVLDAAFMLLMDIMFAFPTILLALTIVAILGAGLPSAMIAIGIVNIPTFARITRGSVLSVREKDYVDAAVVIGAKDWRIMLFHVLPNVMAPIIVQTSLGLSIAVLTEASLSFLGLGAQPPTPSWGTMLYTGQRYIEEAPWLSIFPGVAILLVVLGFNLLGDGLREALDPHMKG